jgi:serine phosphatase RsbU (regulator of sigma subunit)/anti-sigma regulatory factor (Ser/Thr protein kinase)
VHFAAAPFSFSYSQLALLDELTANLLESLETPGTLDAVLDFFVPRIAAHVQISLFDERGEERVAAVRGRPEPGDSEHRFRMSAGGVALGAIRLRGIRGEPQTGEEFLLAAADRCARALANARLFEREQRVSYTFQYAAITAHLPQFAGVEFDAMYEAGRAEALVGGDWYDAFRLRDGRFVVSIGDVVGSGLNAAVAMVNVRQTLRGVAQVHADPVLMLEAADRTLYAQHPERYVTTFVAVIDPVTQSCTYANAGHPAPFLRHEDGYTQPLRGRGIPLGAPDFSAHIEAHHAHLPSGSLLVLYTDGLTEASRDVIEGERRLHDVLEGAPPDAPGVARVIYDAVLPGHASDDVALLTVRFKAPTPVRRWRFDPQWHDVARRARDEIAAALHDGSFSDNADDFSFEMIFAELCANLIRYAPGTIEILLENNAGAAILHVLDKGAGFQFAPRLPSDLFSERGRGLFLIAHLARDFTVDRRAGGGSHARIGF